MRQPGSRSVLIEPFILGYVALYSVLLAAMHWREGFALAEPLFVGLVVGVGFSFLAAWTARGVATSGLPVRRPRQELAVLAVWLMVTAAFITWGIPALRGTGDSPAGDLRLLIGKLMIFVALPFILWRTLWGYRVTDLAGRVTELRLCWRPILVMSAAFVLLQLVAGQAPALLRARHATPAELACGVPLAFGWLLVEVGLVEEFFFRALLQHRLAAILRSETRAVVVAALLFGLAHAPGMYLRPEMTGEAVGHTSSLLMAVGYAVVITSTTGFCLGVLWARTRNLAAVSIVHAAGDLLPNLPKLLKLFGWQ
jgi:membrane protease YdiL (CAAX protease family)